jgi:ParB-like chromosome segregation protein Spo0J
MVATIDVPPRLDFVELSKITPNKINPRGPNVQENDPHRDSLKESMAQFGILVPLVVRSTGGGEFEGK